jgi:hypothetical protein
MVKLNLGKLFNKAPKMPTVRPKVVGIAKKSPTVVKAQYTPKTPKARQPAALPRGGTNLARQGKLSGQARLDQGFTSTRQLNMNMTAKRTQKKPLFNLPKMPQWGRTPRPAYGFSSGYYAAQFALPPVRNRRMLISSRNDL